MQTGRREWLGEMPGVVSLQLAPRTLSGAVGGGVLPCELPAPQELSHPHGKPVASFPASAVLRRAGQRRDQSIPV